MPNLSHLTQTASKTFNISVIGPQKSGKSCFCSRFTSSQPEYYHQDHTSLLNAVDFSNEIINGDHWLYWGTVTRQVEDCMVHFRIVEQTEFVDDTTFQSFHSHFTGFDPSVVNMAERSTALHLSSNNKLKYVCKEQFGHEDDYDKEYFPSDGVEVNGFILICEPFTDSKTPDNLKMVQTFLSLINRSKRPAVLAISKCDTVAINKDVLSVLRKSMELRRIPLLQTSANENVNIEQTFTTLAKLIEKPRATKPKVLSYHEALDERDKRNSAAFRVFNEFLSHCPIHVLKCWDVFANQFGNNKAVKSYVHIAGSSAAQTQFEIYVKEKNRELMLLQLRRIPEILSQLVPSLDIMGAKSVEGVIAYLKCHKDFHKHFFEDTEFWNGNYPSSKDSDGIFLIPSEDDRIPFSLVLGSSARGDLSLSSPLSVHLNELMTVEQRHAHKVLLETALHQHQWRHSFNHHNRNTQEVILPGQPMSEDHRAMDIFRNCKLSTECKQSVYKHFQQGLRVRAREDYLDLLLEHTGSLAQAVSVYLQQLHSGLRNQTPQPISVLVSGLSSWLDVSNPPLTSTSSTLTSPQLPTLVPVQAQPHALFCYHRQDATHCSFGDCGLHPLYLFSSHLTSTDASIKPPPPPRGLKEMQLSWLEHRLAQDSRYQAMAYLPSEKQALLTSQFDLLLPMCSRACYAHLASTSSSHPSSLSGTPANSSEAKAGRRYSFVPGSTPSNSLPVTRPIIRPYQLSTRSAQLPKFSHSVHTLDSGSSLTCPSLPWGGCIDQLMQRLAYRHFPINAKPFERKFSNTLLHKGCVLPYSCTPSAGTSAPNPSSVGSTELLLPLLAPVYASNASNQSPLSWPPVVLSIGVVCICSDSLAAHAVVPFLASAGFTLKTASGDPSGSMEPLVGDAKQLFMSPLPPSRRGKSVSFEASDCSLSHVTVLNLPQEPDTKSPVVISSPWPLATDRLPSVCQVDDNVDAPIATCHNGERRRSRFQNGLVQASLMSLHKMLNIQLHSNAHHRFSPRTSTERSDPPPNETSTQNSRQRLTNQLHHRSPYDGFIFVVTAPSDSESNSDDESGASGDRDSNFSEGENLSRELNNGAVRRRNTLSTNQARQVFHTRDHSFDTDEAEIEDCARTPQPGVHLSFFPIGDLSETPVALTDPSLRGKDQNLPPSDCNHLPPCRCCLLFTGKRCTAKGCHCSSCCQCPYSLARKSSCSKYATANTPAAAAATKARESRDLDMAPGEMAPRRRRWQARATAVTAALEQVPKGLPHLVLLADQSPGSVSDPSESQSDSHNWPLLYPAPKSWFSRTNQSTPHSSSDSFLSVDEARSVQCNTQPPTANGRCSVQRDSTSSSQSSSVSGCDKELSKGLASPNPSDWMPAGTSVLDHVIRFLADCWDHFDLVEERAGNSEYVKPSVKRSTFQPSSCATISTGRPASTGSIVGPELTPLRSCQATPTCLSSEVDQLVIGHHPQAPEKVTNFHSGLGGGLLTTGRRVFKRISASARRSQNRASTTTNTTAGSFSLTSTATTGTHANRKVVHTPQTGADGLVATPSIGVEYLPAPGPRPPPPLSSCDSPRWWNEATPSNSGAVGSLDDRLHCVSWTAGDCHFGTRTSTLRTQAVAATTTASLSSDDSLSKLFGHPPNSRISAKVSDDVTDQPRPPDEGWTLGIGQAVVGTSSPSKRFSATDCHSRAGDRHRAPSPLLQNVSAPLVNAPTSGKGLCQEGTLATLNNGDNSGGSNTIGLVNTASQNTPINRIPSQVRFEESASYLAPGNLGVNLPPEDMPITGDNPSVSPNQPADSPVCCRDPAQLALGDKLATPATTNEETHLIYEELDMLVTPTGKNLPTPSYPSPNTTLSRGATLLTSFPTGDDRSVCLDQEHIYAEVVDCLTVARLERHPCSTDCKWVVGSQTTCLPTVTTTTSSNSATVYVDTGPTICHPGGSGSSEGLSSNVPTAITAVSSSETSCYEIVSQQRSEDLSSQGLPDTRPERHRSFSNPEGSGSHLLDLRQNCADTSIPMPLAVGMTSSDHIDTKSRQCHSLSLDVGLQHPRQLKGPTRVTESNHLALGDSSGDSLSAGEAVSQSLTGAHTVIGGVDPDGRHGNHRSRNRHRRHHHHHHFWHHRLCPHYHLHGGCCISLIGSATRNVTDIGPAAVTVDQRSRPPAMSEGNSPLAVSTNTVNGSGKSSEGVSLRRLKQRSIPGFSSSERISKSSLAMPLDAPSTREVVSGSAGETPPLTNSTGLSLSSGNVAATISSWKDLKWMKRGKKLNLFHTRRVTDSRRASQAESPPSQKGSSASPRPSLASPPGDEQVHQGVPGGTSSSNCYSTQSELPAGSFQQRCRKRWVFSTSPARAVENRSGVRSAKTDATCYRLEWDHLPTSRCPP